MATEAGLAFFSILAPDLTRKDAGLVRTLFESARAKKPSLIFIDEVDSLCDATNIKTELLAQIQSSAGSGIFVLGATNAPLGAGCHHKEAV